MSFWPFLLLQVVIFAALVAVLRRLLGRNLTDASAQLQHLNAEYTRRHEELKQRLEEAEQQYKEQMTRAKVEAEQLVTRARQEAESSRARLLEDAHGESERIVRQGAESRDALRRELEEAMDAKAIEHACTLLQTNLSQPLRAAIHAGWLQELLANGLTELRQLRSDDDVREARVVCAFPLTAQQRQVLSRQMREAFGREISMTETTNERLVAGLTITLGSRVLDGSLASRIRQTVRHAQITS